jgi:hypothetical protein
MKSSLRPFIAHALRLAVAGWIVCVPAYAGDVFKWKDANGTTVYSDHAPSGRPAERVAIETRSSESEQAPDARLEAERATWARADAERAAQKAAETAQRQAQEKARAEQCRSARVRAARFSVDGRRYRIDEKGERHYYSAEEIDRERAESKKQMDEFCQPAARTG